MKTYFLIFFYDFEHCRATLKMFNGEEDKQHIRMFKMLKLIKISFQRCLTFKFVPRVLENLCCKITTLIRIYVLSFVCDLPIILQ